LPSHIVIVINLNLIYLRLLISAIQLHQTLSLTPSLVVVLDWESDSSRRLSRQRIVDSKKKKEPT
jgi:hypothetical protein